MGANLFLNALFWFFAIVGVFSLISDFAGFVVTLRKEKNEPYVVLTVKDQQENVEGLIRGVVWQNLHTKNGGRVPKIIVVDLGSTDNTPDILKKLAGDYDFVQITDKEGYIKLIREMA